jgi:hypothetical protein
LIFEIWNPSTGNEQYSAWRFNTSNFNDHSQTLAFSTPRRKIWLTFNYTESLQNFVQRLPLCDVFSAPNKPKAGAEKMWRSPSTAATEGSEERSV